MNKVTILMIRPTRKITDTKALKDYSPSLIHGTSHKLLENLIPSFQSNPSETKLPMENTLNSQVERGKICIREE